MEKSESIAKIAGALSKSQSEINAAVKDSKNPHFGSMYADITSVIEAAKPALNANGISFLQGVYGNETGVSVETMLLHVSGEWLSSTLTIPASKHDAQGYCAAITYGRRYGLQSMCGLPAEDDDGNTAVAGMKQQQAESQKSYSDRPVSKSVAKRVAIQTGAPDPTELPSELAKEYAQVERVKKAKVRCTTAGTEKELMAISDYCDELVANGDLTAENRAEINAAVKQGLARVKAVKDSPHNPDNK